MNSKCAFQLSDASEDYRIMSAPKQREERLSDLRLKIRPISHVSTSIPRGLGMPDSVSILNRRRKPTIREIEVKVFKSKD